MENIPVAAAAVGRGGRTPGEPPQSLASPSAMSTEVTEVRDSCSSIPDWAGAWAEGCPTLLARSATTGSCSETSLELFVPWHWREKGTSWARSTWIPAGPRDPGDLGDPIAHPSIDFGIFNLAWSKGRPGGQGQDWGCLFFLSLRQ